MKFTLTLYVCSLIAQQCYIPAQYPVIKENYYQCIRDGLGESFEHLFTQQNFTQKMITDNQLYSSYTCVVIDETKDKPKI